MWPSREPQRLALVQALQQYDATIERLPGLSRPARYKALSQQIIASLRREDFYRYLQKRKVDPRRADPNDPLFDAERAVAWHVGQGNVDEAGWLIFLMTHFARPAESGWLMLRDIYGKLGTGQWTWQIVSTNPAAFSAWVSQNLGNIRGKFGNHRKYESLRADANRPLSTVVEDYVRMVGQKGHSAFFTDAARKGGNDPFDYMYQNLSVLSFGRLAKFDYLMLLSRYGLVTMAPISAYLASATGPKHGARLLFDGNHDSSMSPATLQQKLDRLDNVVALGMAVWEDSLCNWQKSSEKFIHFTG